MRKTISFMAALAIIAIPLVSVDAVAQRKTILPCKLPDSYGEKKNCGMPSSDGGTYGEPDVPAQAGHDFRTAKNGPVDISPNNDNTVSKDPARPAASGNSSGDKKPLLSAKLKTL